MSDNLQDRGQRDRSRINPSEEWEIEYMKEKTGATDQEIEEAVKAVGNSREKVEEFLTQRKR